MSASQIFDEQFAKAVHARKVALSAATEATIARHHADKLGRLRDNLCRKAKYEESVLVDLVKKQLQENI